MTVNFVWRLSQRRLVQMPMTSVDRAASTTSSVMVCSSLIFMTRSIWVNSRSTSRKLPWVMRAMAAKAWALAICLPRVRQSAGAGRWPGQAATAAQSSGGEHAAGYPGFVVSAPPPSFSTKRCPSRKSPTGSDRASQVYSMGAWMHLVHACI